MNRPSFVERILARATVHPDQIVLEDERGELTADELRRLVVRLARALEDVGVQPGDRVAIAGSITREALASRYAAGLLGCATVFCPNTGVPGRLAGFVTRVRAAAVVVFPETAPAARELETFAPGLRLLSVGAVEGALNLLDVDSGCGRGLVAHPVCRDALAVMVASGGTTGESKVSRRSFGGWERVVDAGSMRERRLLVCTSFAYVAQVLVDQVLLGGGVVVLCDGFSPREVLATIAFKRITHLALVEPLLVELIDHPEFGCHDLSSLVAISHIGADAAPSLRRRLLRRAGPVLANPYGASEVGIVSVLAGDDYRLGHAGRLATSGRALPGVDLRIERPDGTEAAIGEEGLISVRSPQVADGYDATVRDSGFRNGRYYSGDLGMLDPDGYLYVRGRAADRRRVADRWVMPVDVQHALCDHPDVRYAVAIPSASAGGRDRGFSAVVVLAPGATTDPAGLRTFVADAHGDQLVPEQVVAVDRVPVTEQGKPDRARLAILIGRAQAAHSELRSGHGDRRSPASRFERAAYAA
ncbi:MAG TPA: AMP-binding protein [Solirubrobacteraceae bacterium]|jgi:fatty-acyl-CoA synthase|nr:AMP-binding protein [Solirubrobacteraceae bacterium]